MKIDETRIEYLMHCGPARIFVKRDDLIPFSFGGNKVRIAAEVFREMEAQGADTVISYGSASSNLNRVVAHMAAAAGKKCRVIIKKEEESEETFNEKMLLGSGAELIFTKPEDVRMTVHETLKKSREAGEKPYYIYGDETGKGGEEVLRRAYRAVFPEILRQEQALGAHFSEIYLAVGTGSTYEGLRAAADADHRIRGISIARTHEDPDITDDYLMGGYGKYTPEVGDLIRKMLREHALPLDPTYTGKAFYGMLRELEKGDRERDVLFLHTGGTPIFYDFLRKDGQI